MYSDVVSPTKPVIPSDEFIYQVMALRDGRPEGVLPGEGIYTAYYCYGLDDKETEESFWTSIRDSYLLGEHPNRLVSLQLFFSHFAFIFDNDREHFSCDEVAKPDPHLEIRIQLWVEYANLGNSLYGEDLDLFLSIAYPESDRTELLSITGDYFQSTFAT